MNDAEYIRKGVELARGWHIQDSVGGGLEYVLIETGNDVDDWVFTELPQHILDALAAQLVRQVDEIQKCRYEVFVNAADTAIRDGTLGQIAQHFGKDRTRNTIKAIINSKVLEQ